MKWLSIIKKDCEIINFDELEIPKTPNYALMRPNIQTETLRHLKSPIFSCSLAELKNHVSKVMLAEKRVKRINEEEDRHQQVYVRRSLLLHFPVIIHIQFQKIAGGTSFLMFSKTRYGRSDFHVNPNFIKKILKNVLEDIKKTPV